MNKRYPLGGRFGQPAAWAILLSVLAASFCLSVAVGSTSVSINELLSATFTDMPSREQLVILTLRIPRAIAGAMVGAGLAVAGAVMQAVTRNPLASPQIFGISGGASLALVLSAVILPNAGSSASIYFAFAGAALGGCIVYTLASASGMTPVKLALAGMAVHLLLSSTTQGLLVFNEQISNVLYWLTGAIDGVGWADLRQSLPWFLLGMGIALALSPSLSILNLGKDTAQGLGQNVGMIQLLAAIAVILLAGSSVSVAGPIGFIGLMVPNMIKAAVGQNYIPVIPLSAIGGASLLLLADVLSRFIAYPYESPAGIVIAMLGAPFFLYLVRKTGGRLS